MKTRIEVNPFAFKTPEKRTDFWRCFDEGHAQSVFGQNDGGCHARRAGTDD
jgi:hypothetical protein